MTDANTYILELNDYRLCLNGNGECKFEPGYAVFDDKEIITGNSAKTQYRLRPLNASNQFWDQVSVDPIRSSTPSITHNADLVYHQLKALLSSVVCESLIIAAPASFSDRQLALILGICQSLTIPVASVVDSALLQSITLQDGTYYHLDFLLHQAIITEIKVEQRHARKHKTLLVPGCGISRWEDLWARAIADEFIRQTRYNPLHDADSEQELYLQLNQWLIALKAGESEIELAGQAVKLSLNHLLAASLPLRKTVEQHLSSIVDPSGVTVLSPTASEITSIAGDFPNAITLSDHDIRSQALQFLDQLSDDHGETALIEQLTLADNEQSSHRAASSNIELSPTHVLVNHSAYPLVESLILSPHFSVNSGDSFITLSQTDSGIFLDCTDASVTLNESRVSPKASLKIGDRIRYQDHCATMIRVI